MLYRGQISSRSTLCFPAAAVRYCRSPGEFSSAKDWEGEKGFTLASRTRAQLHAAIITCFAFLFVVYSNSKSQNLFTNPLSPKHNWGQPKVLKPIILKQSKNPSFREYSKNVSWFGNNVYKEQAQKSLKVKVIGSTRSDNTTFQWPKVVSEAISFIRWRYIWSIKVVYIAFLRLKKGLLKKVKVGPSVPNP